MPYAKALRRREASLRERPLSFGGRPWCDVLAAHGAGFCVARARDTALAISGEEAQHTSLLRTRTVPRWLWPRRALCKGTATARGLSLTQRGRGATCQLRAPTHSRLLRRTCAHAHAPLHWLSLGSRRSTRACCTRAPCRASCGRCIPYSRALHRREAFLLQRAALVRRASCGLPHTTDFRVALARAPLRWLSLGSRRRTRACCTCVPCRAGCGQPMSYARALPWREASLLRCAAVVRRASWGLQRTADFCVAHTRAPLRCMSLGSRRSTRACWRAVPR